MKTPHHIMELLYNNPTPLGIADIQAASEDNRASIASALDTLIRRGHVRADRDQGHDAVRYVITDEGREVYEAQKE